MADKRRERRGEITPWRPFSDLFELSRNFRDIFDQAWDEWSLLPRAFRRTFGEEKIWSPVVDVINQKDKIVVKAELPGMEKEDVKVAVDNGTLTLSGERKSEEKVEKKDYYYSERSYGTFSRTIDLPTSVDSDKVKASYKDGMLEITLPKIEEEEGKKEIIIE